MYHQTVTIELECQSEIKATGNWEDYGVPGSPRWMQYEPVDFSGLTIDIAGVTVALKDLPIELRNAIWKLAYEASHDGEWE